MAMSLGIFVFVFILDLIIDGVLLSICLLAAKYRFKNNIYKFLVALLLVAVSSVFVDIFGLMYIYWLLPTEVDTLIISAIMFALNYLIVRHIIGLSKKASLTIAVLIAVITNPMWIMIEFGLEAIGIFLILAVLYFLYLLVKAVLKAVKKKK
jgi:hypothetical protein